MDASNTEKCLILHTKGYHVFCDWRNLANCKCKSIFINHCKYCYVGMVNTRRERWADDEGNTVENIFLEP